MIWWPFITKYDFQPEWGRLIQLTSGLYVKYTVLTGIQPKYKFEVYIGENHWVISNPFPIDIKNTFSEGSLGVFHVLSITRKKNVITMTINGEARKYYLKSPSIWKVKSL